MDKIVELNSKNDVRIHDVNSSHFKSYGRVIKEINVDNLISIMDEKTEIPSDGNVYEPSISDLENTKEYEEIKTLLYGGMPIQIGYCNGKNSLYNGFEYHKGNEVNIAVTDFVLALGHSYDIENNTYDFNDAEVFFVPKGTVVSMFETTLHLSPIRVEDDGFKDIVVLPKGTNTDLSSEEKEERDQLIKEKGDSCEEVLLLQKNKWVICHDNKQPLVEQGAHVGIFGENKSINY
ncbi:MAG: DUF4867 family protein [Lachnospiraceae bacterium]|nr:DUF4867 family protein [Lachnospiraceae bacterium]